MKLRFASNASFEWNCTKKISIWGCD